MSTDAIEQRVAQPTAVSAKPDWRFASERRLGRIARQLVGFAEAELPWALDVLGREPVLAATRREVVVPPRGPRLKQASWGAPAGPGHGRPPGGEALDHAGVRPSPPNAGSYGGCGASHGVFVVQCHVRRVRGGHVSDEVTAARGS